MTLFLVLFSLLGANFEKWDVPVNPRDGLALDADGAIWGIHTDGKGGATLSRFVKKGSTWEKTFSFPQTFAGQAEILLTKENIGLVHYDNGLVEMYTRQGKRLWQSKVYNPIAARIDEAGNIWVLLNSGLVCRKTPDSSAVEPIIKKNGAEMFVGSLLDVAPFSNGDMYYVDEYERFVSVKDGTEKVLGKLNTQRILRTKLGGVIAFVNESVVHVNEEMKIRTLWKVPEGLGSEVRFMQRGLDGRIILGIPGAGKGTLFVLSKEVEK